MPGQYGRTLDEALLSGYLDDALVQGDAQRVRVHLGDCTLCHAVVEELRGVREIATTSTFTIPHDHGWSEAPRTDANRFALGLAWSLVMLWVVLVGRSAL